MERVVRRTDLQSDDSASPDSPGSEIEDSLRDIQQFDYIAPPTNRGEGYHVEAREAEGDVAFNLFAPSRTANDKEHETDAPQKIRLRSPSIENTEPGFLGSGRDRSYYFVDTLSNQAREEFDSSALTGEQVLIQSHSPWPGSHHSWKVLKIPSSQQPKDVVASAPLLFSRLVGTSQRAKRTRPGKKYRIKLRTKRAALVSKQEAAKAAAEAKQAAEREKKTRKNREKKAKKRTRDKAKAAAVGEDAAPSQADLEESADDT